VLLAVVKSSQTRTVVNRAANAFRGLLKLCVVATLLWEHLPSNARLGAPRITAAAHKLARIFLSP